MLFSILWVYSSSGVCDLDRNYFPNSLIIIMRIMVKIYVTAKELYLNRDSKEKKCEFFSVSVKLPTQQCSVSSQELGA